ncbi:LysR family transcriptional regulator [Desulfuromonas versatilis]|uniref:LysR family transcriptional regulator n=1 Tax=Desulfuromonas versatilis TaxID=2802975 RepID=A0ABN6DWV7_9BACT|nr:LysR family transcriptional regulator [Desulfuromonas versatilis]BCR04606.1 LysR family transcriptional regulator [Desulfuromonas versatilis]
MQMLGVLEFVRVVETRGFASAARDLGISKACVSQRVRQLEDRLGTRLLQRTTRRVSLTEAGEIYYHHAREVVLQLQQGEERVRDFQESPKGPIRVSMIDGGLGEWYLAPALARFAARNPGVSLDIDLSARLVDLVAEGFDFAIRAGELADSSLIARKLSSFRYGIYASPDYLAARGTPLTPEQLGGHNCLTGSVLRWKFKMGERLVEIRPQGSWHSKSGQALIAAACEGVGIVRTASIYALQSLAAGELVELFGEWTKEHTPIWIVYPSGRHLPRRVSCAVSFLLEEFRGRSIGEPSRNEEPLK